MGAAAAACLFLVQRLGPYTDTIACGPEAPHGGGALSLKRDRLSLTSTARIRLPSMMESTPGQLGPLRCLPLPLPRKQVPIFWVGPCLGLTTLLFHSSGPGVALGGINYHRPVEDFT